MNAQSSPSKKGLLRAFKAKAFKASKGFMDRVASFSKPLGWLCISLCVVANILVIFKSPWGWLLFLVASFLGCIRFYSIKDYPYVVMHVVYALLNIWGLAQWLGWF